MSESVTIIKRSYFRAKNELISTLKFLEENNDVIISSTNIVKQKEFYEKYTLKFQNYLEKREVLENTVSDEQLDEIIKKEDITLSNSFECLIDKLKAEIKQFEYEEDLKVKEKEESRREKEESRREKEYEAELKLKELEYKDKDDERQKEIYIQELKLKEHQLSNSSDVNDVSKKTAVHNVASLPKIDLVKFSGDPLQFQEFHDNFSGLVDSRTDLDDSTKFQYLKAQLCGKAANLVSGIRVTNANYKMALDILKEEYGSSEIIINKIISGLNDLKLCSNKYDDVRIFYTSLETKFKLLENQKYDVEHKALKTIIFPKLPIKTQKDLIILHGENVKVSDIRKTMKNELQVDRILKSMNPHLDSSPNNFSKKFENNRDFRSYTAQSLASTANQKTSRNVNNTTQCNFCLENHFSDYCKKFNTLKSRKEQVKDCCFNCFSKGHFTRQCKTNIVCIYCQKSGHNRALCSVRFSQQKTDNNGNKNNTYYTRSPSKVFENSAKINAVTINTNNGDVPCSDPEQVSLCSTNILSKVFLQTASILISNVKTLKNRWVRVIFDTASSQSYITSDLFNYLNCEKQSIHNINVYTFGAHKPKTLEVCRTSINLFDKYDKSYNMCVNVVPTIVGHCDSSNNQHDFAFIKRLKYKYGLADQIYYSGENTEFSLLIGNDYYHQFISGDKIKILDNLYLLDSPFGFIVSGRVDTENNDDINHSDTCFVNFALFTQVDFPLQNSRDFHKFWDLETLGIKDSGVVSEDDLALQNFEKTLNYKNDRYYVNFPWRDESKEIQSNYGLAVGRLGSLIKRHKKDGILKTCETTFEEQLKSGILEIVEEKSVKNSHYLPYHAVVKKQSETTKIRFVMDASAKQVKSQHSLNDILYRGPVLLENLCSILLRFRLSKYGLISDIEKAFLNVGLNEEERDYTRIVWVKDPSLPLIQNNIITYRHTRLPFGITSSPFLLACVIQSHLSKYEDNDFGSVLQKLKTDFYVDNLVSGVETEVELNNFIRQSCDIFSKASFNLRAWTSNHNTSYLDNLHSHLKSDNYNQSVLGVNWNTDRDTLSIKDTFIKNFDIVTKRNLLCLYGSFHDIMGLWSPTTVSLKLLIQSAWDQGKDWDDNLDSQDAILFKTIYSDLKRVPNFSVPRLINCFSNKTIYELHAFSDACNKSYACCIYFKYKIGNEICVNLIFSKVRVTPKQKLTMPRLELMGLLIAFRSLKFVNLSLQLNIDKYFLWCDNQCVLHWINSKKVLPVFVKNRINEIKASPIKINFNYVLTDENPADIACRGEFASVLSNNNLWWHGPEFLLKDEKYWPVQTSVNFNEIENLDSEISDLTCMPIRNSNHTVTIKKPVDIDEKKFNSFKKLVNVTCYVKKFINIICRRPSSGKGPITLDEFNSSKLSWILYFQSMYFIETITAIKSGQKDQLATQLGLSLDDNGILICKGRFVEIKVDKTPFFPILLPQKSHFTTTIVHDMHIKCFHMGVSQTLSTLRSEYWLIHGRTQVKSIIRNCSVCKKFRGGPYQVPEFSFLPDYRVNKNLSFAYCGVDYFGPLYVKAANERDPKWGIIFTCLTTRAIHLELVDSELSQDLILAFRRFIARRGASKEFLSDNAQQFKLLSNLINTLYCNQNFQNILNENKISFKFTSPLSPWAGGCYERLISIVKQCIRKTIGHILLTQSQLATLLIEVENIVNNRPLGYFGEEDVIITPNHFLGIKRDNFLPDFDFKNNHNQGTVTFQSLLKSWKRGNKYLDIFWRKWHNQYVNFLRERKSNKFKQGKTTSVEPKVGEIVLVKEANQQRSNWPFARVEKLNYGRDGKVRTVDIRFSNGHSVCRSISFLYPMEFD